jgi:hypothetical protein
MIYRYNVNVEIFCPSIESTRELSYEELKTAIAAIAKIPEHKIKGFDIRFEGDVTNYPNAKYGPNWNPDKPFLERKINHILQNKE